MSRLIAKLVLNNYSHATDSLYDYNVPSSMEGKISVGMRVKVPFGRNNREAEAYVFSLCEKSEYSLLKDITEFIDEYSYFDKAKTDIISFMKHRYFCSYISALKCFIPSGVGAKFTRYFSFDLSKEDAANKFCAHSVTADKIISCLKAYGTMSEESIKTEVNKKNVTSVLNKLADNGIIEIHTKETQNIKDAVRTFVELVIDREEAINLADTMSARAKARARVIEVLCDNNIIELSELLMCASCSKSVVDALVERGIAAYRQMVCNDSSLDLLSVHSNPKKQLTPEQQNAVSQISESIEKSQKETYLIHGVTGSGKTEVYLRLIEQTVSKGKDAIFLVPEISLTPQMISLVYGRFGDNVAVLHSKLTLRQRYNEWKRIKNGDVKIVIGARSAIFAPFSNIGLIVVDEEHETSYKSEMSPRYDAIEIARFISKQNQSVLVLASATPSVESYYKAQNGNFKLIEMPNRANKSQLPKVEICDMRAEMESGNLSIFSNSLKNAIENNLKKGEQSILFLNRRGFSGFVSCRSCGYVQKCPNCNVSLTYHKSNGKMICHYCDYKTDVAKLCPSCESKHIRFFGIGTEKIVDELNKLYPKASVIRMDADTTSGRLNHETILKSFGEGKADILVGTQMITKGLDFENVTLVGIVAADMSLSVDDFRAGEKTFDLITQVAGRAGRSSKKGYAIIQTYNPEDEIIIHSSNQDYKSFYENEIQTRTLLMYPPFSEFINFVFSCKNQNDAKKEAESFYNNLMAELKKQGFSGVSFNPSEAPMYRLNGKYRYRFLLKTPYKKDIYNAIDKIYKKHLSNKKEVTISIDVNPNSML